MDAYFSLPSDFATRAIATVVAVITVVLGVRVLPVVWKYIVQIFSKRSA